MSTNPQFDTPAPTDELAELRNRLMETMERLAQRFPPGLTYRSATMTISHGIVVFVSP